MTFIPLHIFSKNNNQTIIENTLINLDTISDLSKINSTSFEISSSTYITLKKDNTLHVLNHSNKYFVTAHILSITYNDNSKKTFFISTFEEATYLLNEFNLIKQSLIKTAV